MAKATAKKRKVIVESTGEAHISATFNNIIISLTKKKVKLFLGLQLVKWVLEVLKKLHTQPKWQQKIVVK
jgi:hypothetical protein